MYLSRQLNYVPNQTDSLFVISDGSVGISTYRDSQ